jgi:hypothetical protein
MTDFLSKYFTALMHSSLVAVVVIATIIFVLFAVFSILYTIYLIVDVVKVFCGIVKSAFIFATTWGGLDINDSYDFLGFGGRAYLGPPSSIFHKDREKIDRIQGLMRELIKAMYCRDVLHNPCLTEEGFAYRMDFLRKCEQNNPDLAKPYSPTRNFRFMDTHACEIYGANEWWEVKRTLELTKENVTPKLVKIGDYSTMDWVGEG